MSSGPVTMVPPPGQEPSTTTSSGEEEVISEEVLRAMSPADLRDLCSKNAVQIPDNVTDEHLLDWLLAEFGV